ncbi:MAG: anti-sigma F factor [Clostridia bacterium]|nr:anti-sigma F factor [Clostridia bacterium]
MHNEMEIRFLSLSGNEGFARAAAAAFAAQLNPGIEELSDIRTAVSEAVTNAIIHGYDQSRDRIVTMQMEIEDDDLTIIVRDDGCGIDDIELARKPFYTSKPELERSGMGFSVMEAFMDSVDVESNVGQGTVVIMRKRIKHANRS